MLFVFEPLAKSSSQSSHQRKQKCGGGDTRVYLGVHLGMTGRMSSPLHFSSTLCPKPPIHSAATHCANIYNMIFVSGLLLKERARVWPETKAGSILCCTCKALLPKRAPPSSFPTSECLAAYCSILEMNYPRGGRPSLPPSPPIDSR